MKMHARRRDSTRKLLNPSPVPRSQEAQYCAGIASNTQGRRAPSYWLPGSNYYLNYMHRQISSISQFVMLLCVCVCVCVCVIISSLVVIT
jgi:hypothetical protein